MARPISVALLLAAVLVAPRARADDAAEDLAERAFTAGDQAYAAGQYLAAARAYENAYELHPSPAITFSIAQAYRRHYVEDQDVAWLEKAKLLYERYLSEQPRGERRAHAITHLGNIALLLAARASRDPAAVAPVEAPTEILVSSVTPGATASIDGSPMSAVPVVEPVEPGPHRVQVSAPGFVDVWLDAVAVKGRLIIVPAELAARPGSLRISTDPGASVWIDGLLVGEAPLAGPVQLAPGTHAVAITARGRRAVSRTVRVDRAGRHTLTVDLETSDARAAAHWTLGGAAGFALAGIALGAVSLAAEADAEEARAPLSQGRALVPSEASRSNAALERRDLTRSLALGSFGVAGAAGLTAGLLFVLDDPGPPRPEERDAVTARSSARRVAVLPRAE